jgi:phosphoesterase RecJ-like protein
MVLAEELQGVNSVGISGHIRPDGDCVGSTLAVYNYIKTYYPQIDTHIFLEEIPKIFLFLQGSGDIEEHQETQQDFDLFIVLDCGDAERLGANACYFKQAKRTICIDHHVSNQSFADKNLIVPDASSTCELVYGVLEQDKITKEIAECIYTGMIHDTGVFQYSCTSRSTMEIAGSLMETGIDYPTIVDKTFYEKTFAQNKVMGQALLKSRLYDKEQCIASVITKEEMAEFQVLPKHLDGIVSQLRITKEADVAIFLYELEAGEFKVSTRCKSDDVDLSKLAVKYHGGGHKKAAGFSVKGSDPWALIQQIVHDVAELRG